MTEVAVNLLWCVPGRVGGSEEYLVRQLYGLAESGTAWAPTLFCSRRFAQVHADLVARFPVELAPAGVERRPSRVGVEHTWLARRTRRFGLVHHGGGTVPSTGARRTLLTIHDLQFLTHPEYHSAVKLRYLRTVVPRSIARATVVATPSEWVRTTVLDAYGADPDRVVVVRHGVGADLGRDTTDAGELRRRYGLGDGPVVVFPAITHPHKGHRFLLEVMSERWTDPSLRLVLLGGAGAADADVSRAIRALGLSGRVIRPGRVPAADRDGLIALAAAVAFPSEYEGFGAPVLEAMALGTPVICNAQPALAEVVGDAGLVLAPDPEAWGAALDAAIGRRAELAAAGRARAANFTAVQSGTDLARAYDLAMAGDPIGGTGR